MGIKLVTFYASTVTPQDDALIYETALSGSGMIYGGTVTIKSANVLHVASGHGALCGRKFTIEETDVPVVLAPTGTLLGRIYIHMDLSDTDEPISLEIETGSALAPVIQQQDVNIIDGVYEINLATFDVDTATISNLENVTPFIDSIPDAEFSPSSQNTIQNKVITKALGNPEIIGGAASQPYVKGELLLSSDGQLYEVTADISYQSLINVGGNVRSTGNIITQISKIANSIKSATISGTTSATGNFTSNIKISERLIICAYSNSVDGVTVLPYTTSGNTYYQIKALWYTNEAYSNKSISITYYYIDK